MESDETHTHTQTPEDRLLFLQMVRTSVIFPVKRNEREGVRKRRRERERESRETDKLQASTLEQLYSAGPTMEFKGVCVLLGVMLLVNCSFQQTPPKKKPAKKGKYFWNITVRRKNNKLCESY